MSNLVTDVELLVPESGDTAAAPPAISHSPPTGTQPMRILWAYAISIVLIHLLCLLTLLPWFFSWTGVVLMIGGHYVFGMLGMTLCYHRLLTHRGFTCAKWFEYLLATLGVCCLQDSPARWVAIHRRHHQHSDEQPDPHSPLVAFLWSHLGWLMVWNTEITSMSFYEHYARDLLREPYYRWLERRWMWLWTYLAHAALFFLAGLLIAGCTTGSLASGVRFGASLLIWGVFVRTVLVWHVTWSVNSLTHTWGYRNYDTADNSRNNWFVGLIAHGEGWHNNHHAEQGSAAHGHKWWEFDLTWQTIRLFEFCGLITNVVRPRISASKP
jgi:stearoyl-CoA desaturase (delta-9 desaturase)